MYRNILLDTNLFIQFIVQLIYVQLNLNITYMHTIYVFTVLSLAHLSIYSLSLLLSELTNWVDDLLYKP